VNTFSSSLQFAE